MTCFQILIQFLVNCPNAIYELINHHLDIVKARGVELALKDGKREYDWHLYVNSEELKPFEELAEEVGKQFNAKHGILEESELPNGYIDDKAELGAWHNNVFYAEVSMPYSINGDNSFYVPCEGSIKIVCPECNGTGKHLNATFRHQAVEPDLVQDEEFMDMYMGGHFDVACTRCHGNNVVDRPIDVPEVLKQYREEAWEEEMEYRAQVRAERMMGA